MQPIWNWKLEWESSEALLFQSPMPYIGCFHCTGRRRQVLRRYNKEVWIWIYWIWNGLRWFKKLSVATSPVCCNMWRFSRYGSVKVRPQCSHECFFVTLPPFVVVSLAHMAAGHFRLLWRCRWACEVNMVWQCAHECSSRSGGIERMTIWSNS